MKRPACWSLLVSLAALASACGDPDAPLVPGAEIPDARADAGDAGVDAAPFDAAIDAQAMLDLAVIVRGDGRVRSADGRIDCPGRCSAPAAVGDTVELIAGAARGSRFRRSHGKAGIGSTERFTVIMDVAQTATVEFVPLLIEQAFAIEGSGYRAIESTVYDADDDALVLTGRVGIDAIVCGVASTATGGVYVAKVAAATGRCLWAHVYPSHDWARARVALIDGDVIVGGLFQHALSIGDRTFASPNLGGFLARLAGSDGEPTWIAPGGAAGMAPIHDLAVAADGTIATCGDGASPVQGWSPAGELRWRSDTQLGACTRIAVGGRSAFAIGAWHQSGGTAIEIAIVDTTTGAEEDHENLESGLDHHDIGRIEVVGDTAYALTTKIGTDGTYLVSWRRGDPTYDATWIGLLDIDTPADLLVVPGGVLVAGNEGGKLQLSWWTRDLALFTRRRVETVFLSGIRLVSIQGVPSAALSTWESDGPQELNGIWLDLDSAAPVVGRLAPRPR